MRPCLEAGGHDAPWLIGEAVPCEAAMIEDIVVGFEHAVRQPVVAHELPDVFDRGELGAFGRQRHKGDIGGRGWEVFPKNVNGIGSLSMVPGSCRQFAITPNLEMPGAQGPGSKSAC
jgi:hypothetical protein